MVNEMRRIDVGDDEANELLNRAGLASVNTMKKYYKEVGIIPTFS